MKKRVNSHKIWEIRAIFKKLVLLFAIYGAMLIGPVVFTFVYYIQATRFQEKALREIEMDEKQKVKLPSIVLRGEE
ncbi:MAG: hypothetical protein A3F16_04050 [Deltaproteobacteria bacterium RIFCSPHIGHO2_12_FULL_43_9]|nr:MAG: hypothetical protein A3F16_04050 [Deltaproteobacteria bacterium RIFCSPHIGHO2_12_FULL_43_9]